MGTQFLLGPGHTFFDRFSRLFSGALFGFVFLLNTLFYVLRCGFGLVAVAMGLLAASSFLLVLFFEGYCFLLHVLERGFRCLMLLLFLSFDHGNCLLEGSGVHNFMVVPEAPQEVEVFWVEGEGEGPVICPLRLKGLEVRRQLLEVAETPLDV